MVISICFSSSQPKCYCYAHHIWLYEVLLSVLINLTFVARWDVVLHWATYIIDYWEYWFDIISVFNEVCKRLCLASYLPYFMPVVFTNTICFECICIYYIYVYHLISIYHHYIYGSWKFGYCCFRILCMYRDSWKLGYCCLRTQRIYHCSSIHAYAHVHVSRKNNIFAVFW